MGMQLASSVVQIILRVDFDWLKLRGAADTRQRDELVMKHGIAVDMQYNWLWVSAYQFKDRDQ